jgi:hypothetical protein
MQNDPQFLIELLLALVGAATIAWPVFELRALRLPRLSEWARVRDDIAALTRDDIEATSYSPVTKQALQLVLARKAGYGRLANIPLALDHIQAAAESLAKAYRALGSQAVVIGLLGTVLTFFLFFSSTDARAAAATADSGRAIDAVFTHLKPIYGINGIAIFVAIWFFNLSARARRVGDAACLAAAHAFHSLEESGQSDLAPELVNALEATAGQFQAFSQRLFEDQFAKIESLLGEVQVLGTGLRSLVEETVARSSKDEEVYQALLRQSSATVDALTARLDAGFQLLAQPFLQGIPAMQALAESSAALKSVTQEVLQANIVQLTTQLKLAVTQLDRATRDLPASVSGAVEHSVAQVQQATREGTEAGIKTVLSPAAASIETAVSGGIGRIGEIAEMVVETIRESERARSSADDALKRYVEAQVVGPVVQYLIALSRTVDHLDDDVRLFARDLAAQLDPIKTALEAAPSQMSGQLKIAVDDFRGPIASSVDSVREAVAALHAETSRGATAMTQLANGLPHAVGESSDRLLHGLLALRNDLRSLNADKARLAAGRPEPGA